LIQGLAYLIPSGYGIRIEKEEIVSCLVVEEAEFCKRSAPVDVFCQVA
jgi:hypothetical protein